MDAPAQPAQPAQPPQGVQHTGVMATPPHSPHTRPPIHNRRSPHAPSSQERAPSRPRHGLHNAHTPIPCQLNSHHHQTTPSWLRGVHIPSNTAPTLQNQLNAQERVISSLREDLANTHSQLNAATAQITVERRRITLNVEDIISLTPNELNEVAAAANQVTVMVNAENFRRLMHSTFNEIRRDVFSTPTQQDAPPTQIVAPTPPPPAPHGLYCPICRDPVEIALIGTFRCGHVCCTPCWARVRPSANQRPATQRLYDCIVCRARVTSPVRIYTTVERIPDPEPEL